MEKVMLLIIIAIHIILLTSYKHKPCDTGLDKQDVITIIQELQPSDVLQPLTLKELGELTL